MKEFTVLCLALNTVASYLELGRVLDFKERLEVRQSRIKWLVINVACFALNLWVLSTYQ